MSLRSLIALIAIGAAASLGLAWFGSARAQEQEVACVPYDVEIERLAAAGFTILPEIEIKGYDVNALLKRSWMLRPASWPQPPCPFRRCRMIDHSQQYDHQANAERNKPAE